MKRVNKEEVFGIMGKYYGNAHYRYCSDAEEHDLLLTVDLLDEINALGYCFSNDQRIVETCDRRFPDILKKYIGRFDDQRFSRQLISAFAHREYAEHVPYLLDLYARYCDNREIRFDISDSVLRIKSKVYAKEYVNIITEPGYERYPDLFYNLCCVLKLKAALPALIELVQINEEGFKWFFVENIWRFHDESLIEYIEPYLDDPDGELRSLAKKAVKKMSGA